MYQANASTTANLTAPVEGPYPRRVLVVEADPRRAAELKSNLEENNRHLNHDLEVKVATSDIAATSMMNKGFYPDIVVAGKDNKSLLEYVERKDERIFTVAMEGAEKIPAETTIDMVLRPTKSNDPVYDGARFDNAVDGYLRPQILGDVFGAEVITLAPVLLDYAHNPDVSKSRD